MSIERLNALRQDNDVHVAYMAACASRFDALRNRHLDGTAPKAIVAFNLFQTPERLAARMAAMIPEPVERILEPSAGLGRLYGAVRALRPTVRVDLVEQSPDCAGELYRITEQDRNATLKQGDFLDSTPAPE